MSGTNGPVAKAPGVGHLQTKLLMYLVLSQFVVQFVGFGYLYAYVSKLEFHIRAAEGEMCNESTNSETRMLARRKRSSAIPAAEDNSVPDMIRIGDMKELLKDSKKLTTSSDDTSGDTQAPAAPNGDTSWVWLTADTRVPFDAMDALCRKSTEYCPPGLPGVPGPQGITGDRGLPGVSGPVGPEGPPGMPGYPGERGPKGDTGSSGLDGRDGIPGEPGLDGVPGRSGRDGLAGMDGKPGVDGIPGRPGRNGTDGKRGQKGAAGPMGPMGPPGSMGRPGIKGTPGLNGKPGTPGVTAYKFDINDTEGNKLLVPPSILADASTGSTSVVEGSNIRLTCAASGTPQPTISWSKTGGSTIPVGAWHASSIIGQTLNITAVNREHLGEYICIADNGLAPRATRKIRLDVQFGPFIRIRHPEVRGQHQGSAILECDVEAFPEPLTWWERGDGKFIESSPKYRMDVYDRRDIYKLKMRLNISRINDHDFGTYQCVVKNSLGTTKGISLLDDGRKKVNLSSYEPRRGVAYGTAAPPKLDLNELCPPQQSCDDCPHIKCGFPDFGGRFDVKVLTENVRATGLPPRLAEGVFEAVGKPVFKGSMDDPHGCWMYDSMPRFEMNAEKLWVTRQINSSYIFEYKNKSDFYKGYSRNIRLPFPFKGNGHIVYNGSFYYNPEHRSSIVRFDLQSQRDHNPSSYQELGLPGLIVDNENYLYSTDHKYSYVDFDADENGLWAIYGLPSNYTVVMKVDAVSLETQRAWNITIDNHKFGEMFIACGVLYAVHNVTDTEMKIRLALDLYKSTSLDVTLSFTNPYRRTTMVRYNHKTKELYTWDRGNLLAYPVKYQNFGYNMTQTLDMAQPPT